MAGDDEINVQITATADGLKAGLDEATSSLDNATSSVEATGAAFANMGEQATVNVRGVRELNMALREMAAGNVGNLPEMLALLSHHFLDLGVMAMGAVAGVAALGAGLFEFLKHAEEAREASDQAREAFAFNGLDESADQIDAGVAQVAEMPNATAKASGEIVADFAKIQQATPQLIQALVDLLPSLAGSMGGATAATKALVEQFNGLDAAGRAAALQQLADAAKRVDTAISAETPSLWDRILIAMKGAGGNAAAIDDAIDKMDDDKLRKVADDLKAAMAAPGGAAAGATADTSSQVSALAQFRLTVDQMEAAWKGSHEAMLAEAIKMWQSEVASGQLAGMQLVAAEETVANTQKQLNAAQAEDAKRSADKTAQAAKEAARQQVEAARQAAAEQAKDLRQWLANYTAGLDTQLAVLKDQLEEKKISEQQWYAQSVALERDRQAVLKQLGDEGTAAYDKSLTAMAALDKQHAAESEKTWTGVTNTITNAMDQMLSGILRGTQTWQQALTKLFDNMALSFIEDIAKMGVQWAVKQAEKLALETATDTAVTAEHTAMNTANSASDAALSISPEVMKHAGSAAAAVYDDVAQIPYVGWILAPPAAAAAFAAVAAFSSFDTGAWSLPSDMLAMVHQGEMIIPADVAGQIRGSGSVPSFASGAGSASGGGGIQINMYNNTNAIDGPSVTAHANRYAQVYAKAIAQVLQRNPSLRGAY